MSDDIHTCSYYCTRPACIRAQRDELRDKMEAQQKAEPVALSDLDDATEHAYWQFDARRKGYAEWKGIPMSERDAFKRECRLVAKRYFPVRNDIKESMRSIAAPPIEQKAEPVAWQPVPLRACIKPTHEAADAFWKYWRENGETHKHGYYESTWGAINAALACGYAAPPLDPEGLRLLREALDWVGLDSPMFEKIDAYLAKYHSGPVVGVPSAQRDNAA